jgi:hypothetical protein
MWGAGEDASSSAVNDESKNNQFLATAVNVMQ